MKKVKTKKLEAWAKPSTVLQDGKILALLSESAGRLAMHAAGRAFEVWKKRDFRMMVDFDNLSRTEQDRIFNELELTALGLMDVFFKSKLSTVGNEKDYRAYDTLRRQIPEQFVRTLEKERVGKEQVRLWRELIKMRFDEYKERLLDAKLLTTNQKEFKTQSVAVKQIWAGVQTLSICGWQHVRRGTTDSGDPLWRIIRDWLTDMYAEMMALIDRLELEVIASREKRESKRAN